MFKERQDILVVGGGISGITVALEAAEAGFSVVLVEKEPFLGGKVAGMNRYFPKCCPPFCGLEINFRRIRDNPRISIFTSTTLKQVSGSEGDFRVSLGSDPAYVNHYCTACGECAKVCPVQRPNEYNMNMDQTTAIYISHEFAFPHRFSIDEDVCLKTECAKCIGVCKYDAINLEAIAGEFEIRVGSIVFATGWEPYDAHKLADLLFGQHKDIVTSLMMERMAAPNGPDHGKILRPSNGEPPENIAFIQCAGSRDDKHLPYCSGVCCSASLKQALYITEQNPNAKIRICYIDLRVMGRNEDFLNRVSDHQNISLVKGKVAKIKKSPENDTLMLETENIMSGRKETIVADLVVLATGIQATKVKTDKVRTGENGFIDASMLDAGIYATGCCKNPKDVALSVKDAAGTALKAIQSARPKP